MRRFLAPYDYTDLSDWKFLTQHITAGRIARTMPPCGLVRTAAEYESCPDAERPRGQPTDTATNTADVATRRRRLHHIISTAAEDDAQLLPDLKVVADTAMRFTALPDRCAQANATPAQITAAFMDCLPAVEQLVAAFGDGTPAALMGIIDECQIAFVCFATGGSVDALAHWRRMLHLLAHSERAVHRWPTLYAAYVRCLQEQLPLVPEEMQPAGEWNTVYRDVQQLVRNCADGTDRPEVGEGVELLVARVRGALGWELGAAETGDEDPDDAPVVVELDEQQSEIVVE